MDNWKIEGPPHNHVRVNGKTNLVPDLFKKLGCPDWNERFDWLKELGYKSVNGRGFSPVFNDHNELKQFVDWAKAKLSADSSDVLIVGVGQHVRLNGETWVVVKQTGYYLYSALNHSIKCGDLLESLIDHDSDHYTLSSFARMKGFDVRFDGDFPEFETLEELTRFYNYCKLQLNEVHRVTETDRDRDQGRAAYSPGQAKFISFAARRSGNGISIGRSKGKIAGAEKNISAACL